MGADGEGPGPTPRRVPAPRTQAPDRSPPSCPGTGENGRRGAFDPRARPASRGGAGLGSSPTLDPSRPRDRRPSGDLALAPLPRVLNLSTQRHEDTKAE